VRVLVKQWWFAVTAVTTLALSLGGYATVFTIATGMIHLPNDANNRIVALDSVDERIARSTPAGSRPIGATLGVSFGDFEDWRASVHGFTAVVAYAGAAMNVTDSGLAKERIMGAYVSADAFRVLGERPVLGRAFLPAEDRPSARPVAILGYAVWKTR